MCTRKPNLSSFLFGLRKNKYDPLRAEHKLNLESRVGFDSNVIQETANRIVSLIETNIKMHFFSRQLRYLRARDNLSKKDAHKRQNEINQQKGGTDASLPFMVEKYVAYDLEVHPECFLYPMWQMNRFFAEKGLKTFALLPLSRGFIPSASLHVDTLTLRSWFSKNDDRVRSYQITHDKRCKRETIERVKTEKKHP